MIKLYIECMGERTLIGEYADRAAVAKAKNTWLEENGFTRYCTFYNGNRICRMWMASDGEVYEDFGSWSTFFVTVGDDL